MKVTTKDNFSIDVKKERAQDWRFVKALALMDSEDDSERLKGAAIAVPFLLGKDGEERLMQHLTDKDGLVSSAAVLAAFTEIINLLGEEEKKSSSSLE